jgi:hypothetical protein
MTLDNSVVISSESVLVILDRESCRDLQKISAGDYVFPSYSDLSQNISNIQAVKKAFIRRYWKVAGREVVRNVAQSRLEAVSLRVIPFFCCFVCSGCEDLSLCR